MVFKVWRINLVSTQKEISLGFPKDLGEEVACPHVSLTIGGPQKLTSLHRIRNGLSPTSPTGDTYRI